MPGLETQLVDLPFGMGIDEKTGKPAVSAGKLLQCTNGRIRKIGSLERRPGFATLTREYFESATNITTARRCMSLDSELLIDNGDQLFSYSTSAAKWLTKDSIPEACVTRVSKGERGPAAREASCDSVYNNGYYVTAWVGRASGSTVNDTVSVRWEDSTTGVRSDETNFACTTNGWMRVIAVGQYVYLFFTDEIVGVGGTFTLRYSRFDTAAPASGWTASSQITDEVTALPFDAIAVSSTRIYLAYVADDGGPIVRTERYSLTLVPGDKYTTICSDTPTHISLCGELGGYLCTTFDDGSPNGLTSQIVDESTVGVTFDATKVLDTSIYDPAGGDSYILRIGSCVVPVAGSTAVEAVIVYTIGSEPALEQPTEMRWIKINMSTGAGVCTGNAYHVEHLSNPIVGVHGDGVYLTAALAQRTNTSTDPLSVIGVLPLQPLAYYLFLPCSSIDPRAGDLPHLPRTVCHLAWFTTGYLGCQPYSTGICSDAAAGKYVSAVLAKSSDLNQTTIVHYAEGFDLYHLSEVTAEHSVPLPVAANHELVLSGGVPSSYDSLCVSEYGFHYAPTIHLNQAAAAGGLPGGTTSANAYGFAVTYEWVDAKGLIQSSAPSFADTTVAMGGADTITVTTTALSLTEHMDNDHALYPVRIVFWRTEANGQVYHWLYSTENTPRAASVALSVTNTITDAMIEKTRILYTDGGVVENYGPPGFKHVCAHVNRLCGISTDDPEMVWFSKLNSYDTLPGFNGDFILRVTGGALNALASIDGKLICFQDRATWVIFGEGPSDTAQGNNFTDPQAISTEIGCTDPRSLVYVPSGVCFRSKSTICLLDKGMQIKPIGIAIEDTLAAYPVTTGAIHDEPNQEVRWTLTTTAGTTGVIVCWNYMLDMWHVWKVAGPAGQASWPARSCCIYQLSGVPTPYYLWTDGRLSYESGYRDLDNTYPDLTLLTSHAHLAGVQGFERIKRIYLLGEYLSGCSITMAGYYNYASNGGAATWTKSWTSGEVAAIKSGERVQVMVHVPVQKCQAMQLAITIGGNTGGGLRLHGLTLQLGVKRGGAKLTAAEKK